MLVSRSTQDATTIGESSHPESTGMSREIEGSVHENRPDPGRNHISVQFIGQFSSIKVIKRAICLNSQVLAREAHRPKEGIDWFMMYYHIVFRFKELNYGCTEHVT